MREVENLLGERLLRAGLLERDELGVARLERDKAGLPLHRVLVRLGFVPEARVIELLAELLGLERVEDLEHYHPPPEVLAAVPRGLALRLRLLPLRVDPEGRLHLAGADPSAAAALDELVATLGPGPRPRLLLAGELELAAALERCYGADSRRDLDRLQRELERTLAAPGTAEAAQQQAVVSWVEALLADAVLYGASDLHCEPEQGYVNFRYRLDGLLCRVRCLHRDYWAAPSVRLKVLAGMDIAERQAPQDGRFSLRLAGRTVDFRVSTLPTLYGENLVLRILNRSRGVVSLGKLGLAPSLLACLERVLARPQGIILVTGPTGSGKTTTLYAMLDHLNREAVHIVTLEEPVEQPMRRARQVSLEGALRMDYAAGVRALLRQDPDILFVGEIRSAEVARLVLRAALTGHLVLATLHAESAAGAVPRLLDLGVNPALLAGNLKAVLAQRLVRRLCDACRQPNRADADEPFQAGACERCGGRGYRGRQPLLEVLTFEEEASALLAKGATVGELQRTARAWGFRSMAEVGLELVRAGITTRHELSRVVDLSVPPAVPIPAPGPPAPYPPAPYPIAPEPVAPYPIAGERCDAVHEGSA